MDDFQDTVTGEFYSAEDVLLSHFRWWLDSVSRGDKKHAWDEGVRFAEASEVIRARNPDLDRKLVVLESHMELGNIDQAKQSWPEIHYEISKLQVRTDPHGDDSLPINDQSRPIASTSPTEYVIGWPELMDAIGRPDTAEERKRIKRMSDETDGPIKTKQGVSPRLNRQRLLEWWASLEAKWDALFADEASTAATVAQTYKHGKTGEVVPEIAGSVKRRRKT